MPTRQAVRRGPGLSILAALDDPALFGPVFRPRASWAPWRAALAALFALPMSEPDLALYRAHTGRQRPPEQPAREGWIIAGRRGGKSRVAALVAVYLAAFRDYAALLAPGEVATVMLIASDRKQARVVQRYVLGLLDSVPMLRALVVAKTAESVTLSNRVVIEIHTASFRSVRGYSIAAVICDEIAFWRSEDSANPDTEIIGALRPAMATLPGSLLLCISSPYARRGALWSAFREHHGVEADPVLTWQAPTVAMNPSVDASVIDAAYATDPIAAAAEYGAQFRRDIESYIDPETLTHLVAVGVAERGPVHTNQYVSFCDPAGGSGGDSMTLAIAHLDTASGKAVLDVVAERRPPFSPDAVAEDFAAILKRYGVRAVTGDRYAGDWPREAFKKRGVRYLVEWRDPKEPGKWMSLPKSDIYKEVLPLLNGHRVELLDDPKLLRQLTSLERRTGSSGRDVIDHGPGQHDDVANAAAGALLLAARGRVSGSPFGSAIRSGITTIGEPTGQMGAAVRTGGPRSSAGVGGQARHLSKFYTQR